MNYIAHSYFLFSFLFIFTLTPVFSKSESVIPAAFKGLSESDFQALTQSGLIRSSVDSLSCSLTDGLTISEKVALSDLVVDGDIASVTYLYRKGGPFRTLYEIHVNKILFGEQSSNVVRVLSIFGPNTRDHRRWKTPPSGLEFQVGDKGIFILDDKEIKKKAQQNPNHEKEIMGSYMFQEYQKGVYLFGNDDKVDTAYFEQSGKVDPEKSKNQIRDCITKVKKVLDENRGVVAK